MFYLFLLLAFARSLDGAPILGSTDFPSHQSTGYSLHTRETSLLDNDRTIWDIVWGCLATIFACTWIVVHPNIPSPKADWKARFKSHLVVMTYAWIAPECITMWAMRQFLSARKLVRLYNEKRGIPEDTRSYIRFFWDSLFPSKVNTEDTNAQRWTLTHGFFAQMGGYMVYRENKPYWTLFLEEVDLDRDMDLVPYYTEAELMDRSKGDVLSKSVALLQTLWFVTQYITRAASRLPLTELETITLAFAVLNIATYLLWWYKPLNVQCPVRVYEAPPSTAPSIRIYPHPQFYDQATPRVSTSGYPSDQLSIPIITFKDTFDPVDVEWDELHETPWFPGFPLPDDGTTLKESPRSRSQTLDTTSTFTFQENKETEGGFWLTPTKEGTPSLHDEYGWDDLNELPWYPAIEVPLTFCYPLITANPDQFRRRVSSRIIPSRVKWRYRISRRWKLPCYLVLVVDGGWYTIHLCYDEIENEDDLASFSRNNKSLSVDFYVPLFLRNMSWMAQMCLLIPLWSPYVVSAAIYILTIHPFFTFLLSPLAAMTGLSQSADEPWLDSRYPLQVPPFYAGPPGFLDQCSRVKIWYTVFFLTSIFGAIHGFGWSAYFALDAERILWHVSTLGICGVPLTVGLWVLYRRSRFPQFGMNTVSLATSAPFSLVRVGDLWQLLKFLAARSGKIGMPIYILGRIALITIAFTSLRNLPPETFKSVAWTSAAPHL